VTGARIALNAPCIRPRCTEQITSPCCSAKFWKGQCRNRISRVRGPSAGSGSKPNSANNSTSSVTARVFEGARRWPEDATSAGLVERPNWAAMPAASGSRAT
jgi:hypothetical protein